MAYPGVTVRILDESLNTSSSELDSPAIGAMIGAGTTLSMKIFAYGGDTGEETVQGYYYVENLNDWFSRLYNFYNTYYPGFSATNGTTLAARDLAANGATAWTDEWYHVHNFLQYGSGCYVTWANSGGSGDFKNLNYDVIFAGGTATSNNSLVTSAVDERDAGPLPVFGVLGVPSTSVIETGMTVTSAPSNGENACAVFGEKKHFNAIGSASTLIVSSLAPDVAGCICRTDRDSYPWFSPAGARRGRINNVVNLTKLLNESQKNILYDAKINPVFAVPGEGTLLWGDKTLASQNSTLSSINVARLFIYLKRTLGPLARGVLFEQNDEITRASFRTAAESVLRQVVAARGITEFKVVCDDTNNTPDLIQNKIFVADILIKPIPAINFVRLTLTNKNLSSTL